LQQGGKPTLCEFVNQVTSRVQLAQRQLVVVLVVQHVEQVGVEGVDVVDFWEVVQDEGELFVPALRRELDLAHVELTDALNAPAIVNDRWCLPLGFAQHDVDEVLCCCVVVLLRYSREL